MLESNGHLNGHAAPSASGGASLALDMTNERDRGMVRTFARRWPKRFARMDAAKQDALVDLLDLARAKAEAALPSEHVTDLDIAKTMDSIVRTGVMIVSVQQRDDHKEADIDNPNPSTIIQNNQTIKVEFDKGG